MEDWQTCPICGAKADALDGDIEYPFGFGCTECYCGAYGYSSKDALEIWISMVEKCKGRMK